jgi:hypothetical protein
MFNVIVDLSAGERAHAGVHGDMRGPGQNPRAEPLREPGRDAGAAGTVKPAPNEFAFTAVAEFREDGVEQ